MKTKVNISSRQPTYSDAQNLNRANTLLFFFLLNLGVDSLFWQLFAGEDEKHQANRCFVLQNKKIKQIFSKTQITYLQLSSVWKRRQKAEEVEYYANVFFRFGFTAQAEVFLLQSIYGKKHFKLDNGRFPFLMTSV